MVFISPWFPKITMNLKPKEKLTEEEVKFLELLQYVRIMARFFKECNKLQAGQL